eukprot:762128-Prymnesium_polylepis.1
MLLRACWQHWLAGLSGHGRGARASGSGRRRRRPGSGSRLKEVRTVPAHRTGGRCFTRFQLQISPRPQPWVHF